MTSEVKKRIERLLNSISTAVSRGDWQTVFDLSEVVLSLDPDSTSVAKTLVMSKQLLQTHPEEVKEQPTAATEKKPAKTHPTSFAEGPRT
jgi:hypothetical protein